MIRKDKRQLTPYGRQIKIALIEKNMKSTDLADALGSTRQRVSEILYGVIPGTRYQAQIKSLLGVDPPAEVTQTGEKVV